MSDALSAGSSGDWTAGDRCCEGCRQGHYSMPGGSLTNFPCGDPDNCDCWFCGAIKTPAQSEAWRAFLGSGDPPHDAYEAALQEAQRAGYQAGVAAVKRAVLDIDAHATPFGEDDDGHVTGGYLISVGSLHRALGVVGHAAPKCPACCEKGCCRCADHPAGDPPKKDRGAGHDG